VSCIKCGLGGEKVEFEVSMIPLALGVQELVEMELIDQRDGKPLDTLTKVQIYVEQP